MRLQFPKLVLALCVLVSPLPALACLAGGPEGYVSGLIWKSRAQEVPADATVLGVIFVGGIEGSWGFRARVTSGPNNMEGKIFRFMPENLNSCVGLGQRSGYIVVRNKPMRDPNPNGAGSLAYLAALDYEPAWYNWIISLFSGDAWNAPGELGQPFEF